MHLLIYIYMKKNSWSSKSISFHRALLETQAVKFRIYWINWNKKGSNFCMKKSRQDCICFVTVVSLLRVKRTQSNFSQKMATLLVLVLHWHQQKQWMETLCIFTESLQSLSMVFFSLQKVLSFFVCNEEKSHMFFLLSISIFVRAY